jgi:hypothetical protein
VAYAFAGGRFGNGPGLSWASAWAALAGANLDLDFVANRYQGIANAAAMTGGRNSPGLAQRNDGSWQSFGINVPRVTDRGLLVEESRTNQVTNSTMTGATVGAFSPPTGWVGMGAPSGCNGQVVALGTELGLETLDERIFGTLAGTGGVAAQELSPQVACTPGQIWTGSFFYKLAAGSLAGLAQVMIGVVFYQSDGTTVSLQSTQNVTPGPTLQRVELTATAPALAAFVRVRFRTVGGNTGEAVDATIRLAAPQLELGEWATSPIRTTGSAATRIADVWSVPITGPNSAAGTIAVEATYLAPNSYGTSQVGASFDDGTLTNRLQPFRITGAIGQTAASAGSSANYGFSATVNQGATVETVLAFSGSSQSAATAGAFSSGTVAVGSIPGTQLSIGRRSDSGTFLNGYVRRVTYWASRLSDPNVVRLSLRQGLDDGAWAFSGATLDMDFVNDRYVGVHRNQLSVTRASVGWAENPDGTFTQFAANQARVTAKGMLVEQQRQNLCAQSGGHASYGLSNATFGPKASMVDPFGTTPWVIVDDANNAPHGVTHFNISFTSGTVYAVSAIVKRGALPIVRLGAATWIASNPNCWFNLDTGAIQSTAGTGRMRQLGTSGWYLLEWVATCDTTTAVGGLAIRAERQAPSISYVGDGSEALYFAHLQVEAGGYASSPIKTAGSAATRQADVITINTGAWYTAGTGTLFAEGGPDNSGLVETANSASLLSLDDTTTNNRIMLRRNNGQNAADVSHLAANVNLLPSQIIGAVGSWVTGSKKLAEAWAQDDFQGCAAGQLGTAAASGTPAVITTMRLGVALGASVQLGGYLRRAAYHPSRLPNATLQAMTA